MSVPDAIGIAIEKWMQEKQGVQQDLLGGAVAPASAHAAAAEGTVSERTGEAQDFIGACPDCGSQLAFAEGCAKCHVCGLDRKSTRLNSSHSQISYAVFCLKKKKQN